MSRNHLLCREGACENEAGANGYCMRHTVDRLVEAVTTKPMISPTSLARPPFEQIFMDLARSLAKRSTCSRLNVGTVITSADYRYVYGMGYNGNATGLPNQCDSSTPGACGCIHSEANAIINCNTPRSESKIVFVTNLPCVMCAKYLVNLGGVQRVYYREDYRIRDALGLLTTAGIEIVQFSQA